MALVTDYIKSLDASRNIQVTKIAEMNGGFTLRNKIIDGKFDFWYEGTSQTTSGYGSDTMWRNRNNGTTKTHSRQSLTVGVDLPAIDCPPAKYFSRTVVTSVAGASNYCDKYQPIESVRTLAGKNAVFSFYAKADSSKNIGIYLYQNFGTGGSPSTSITVGLQLVALTTAWKKYSVVIAVPSISGKTIGTNGDDTLNLTFTFDAGSSTGASIVGQQSGTFDIACVQLEEGSVATPFEELPLDITEHQINRYYQYIYISVDSPIGYSPSGNTTSQIFTRAVPMRAIPAQTFSPQTGGLVKTYGGAIKSTSTSLSSPHCTHFYFDIQCTFSSYTYAAGDFVNITTYSIADARL